MRPVLTSPVLNLIVIRSSDIDKSAAFYTALGIRFSKHSHGNGPEHYASEDGPLTFEIYPQVDSASSTTGTRLGFKVPNLDALLALITEHGGRIISAAQNSPWGRRAIVADPSGHKIELVEETVP